MQIILNCIDITLIFNDNHFCFQLLNFIMRFAPSTLTLAVCSILSSNLWAETNLESPIPSDDEYLKFTTIVVKAKAAPEIGRSTYNQQDLQRTANSSKSITDFLKVNPNVQFSNNHLAAGTQANLKPSEISIHGAQSFQNKFMINGVSNTNILDPVGAGTSIYGGIDAGSQGVALNTDLLCNLELLDSNISAKHGGFTGGVISADTCAPTSEIGKIHGSISYDYTSSDWVSYHLKTDADKGLFDGESSQENQKQYTRQGLSTNIYSKLSEHSGINLFASHRQSNINVLSGLDSPKMIDQKKINQNLGGTFFYDPDPFTSMKFGLTLGNSESNGYAEKRINSHHNTHNESALIFAQHSKIYDLAKVTQKINYQQIDNSRLADKNYGINWLYAPDSKNWSDPSSKAMEGSSNASIDLAQHSFNYELESIFNVINFASTAHHISAGLGYNRNDVKWERTKDYMTFYGVTSGVAKNLYDLDGGQCQADDLFCDEATTSTFINAKVPTIYNGQYFGSGSLYKAGTFQGTYQQAYLFAEDDIHWNKLKARFGVRADYDQSNNNLNIAPRTRFSYQPFYNPTLELTTGWNRYYSAPTYITDLRQALMGLDFKISREDQNAAWTEQQNYNVSATRKSDLKTPYADEFILGVASHYKNTNIALKWVNRQYKDEISRNRSSISVGGGFNRSFEFGNNGYGKNNTVTLGIDTLEPLQFKATHHNLGLAINYSQTFRGTPDYTEDYNEADMEELVSYNGKIIHYADRPASNFNQPITARIKWDMHFDHLPLTISNFFSYKDSFEQVLSSNDKVIHEGVKLDTYVLQDVKPRFSWDMRTTYEHKINKDHSAIFGLTINNLTNRNNLYVAGSKLYSEIGRQVVADVTFKF